MSISGTPITQPLVVRYSSGDTIRFAHKYDSANDLIVDLAPYAVNRLLGLTRLATATNSNSVPSANLDRSATVIQSLSTDMLGPYQVMATANGDGGAERWTGGAHNQAGAASSSGVASARQISLSVYLDGVQLSPDGVIRYGDRLEIVVVNRVQGYNTTVSSREILEETQTYSITEYGVAVHVSFKALEALTITRYYGLQASHSGMASVHWPQGTPDTRQTISGNMNPGTKASNPNISRFCMRSASGFNLVGWLDRAYGIGTCSGLFSTLNISFIDATAQKIYFYQIRDTGLALAANASAAWRGGFYFGADAGTPNADLTHTLNIGGKKCYVVDFLAAGSGVVPTLAREVNRKVFLFDSYGSPVVDSLSGASGVTVVASAVSSARFML